MTRSQVARAGDHIASFARRIFSHAHDGRRAAHGDGVIVWYDYATGRSAAIPDDPAPVRIWFGGTEDGVGIMGATSIISLALEADHVMYF